MPSISVLTSSPCLDSKRGRKLTQTKPDPPRIVAGMERSFSFIKLFDFAYGLPLSSGGTESLRCVPPSGFGSSSRRKLIVVTVVVLQNDIDKNLVTLTRDHHRLGMQDLFVFAQLLNELLDPVFI